MTTTNARDQVSAAVRECAANIVADFQRQDIPPQTSIAIAATVVGMLIGDLPAEQRATFLRAYTNDLLRIPRLDA